MAIVLALQMSEGRCEWGFGTYKIPSPKIQDRAILVMLGTCNLQTAGNGMTIITRSMNMSIALTEEYAAFWFPHFPPAIVGSQLKLKGEQRRNPTSIVITAQETLNTKAKRENILRFLDGKMDRSIMQMLTLSKPIEAAYVTEWGKSVSVFGIWIEMYLEEQVRSLTPFRPRRNQAE